MKELKPYIRKWHDRAKEFSETLFEETWFDFCEGIKKVKFPKGEGAMHEIYNAAISSPVPLAAYNYEQTGLRFLVTICRELQRHHKNGPFFLSSRTAARLIEANEDKTARLARGKSEPDHKTAWRWLRGLVADEILFVESEFRKSDWHAQRYRYLPPLDE